jgi:hypothetical protein
VSSKQFFQQTHGRISRIPQAHCMCRPSQTPPSGLSQYNFVTNTNYEPSRYVNGRTGWRSWLRGYATSRKVAGSSSDEVIGFSQFT